MTPPSFMADPLLPERSEQPGTASTPAEADFTPVGHIYDRIATAYADRFGDDLKPGSGDRAFLDVALASARGSGPVLDVGCGPGQIAAIAIAAGMPAIGTDISPGMLAVARRLVPLGRFLRADARALPLAAASCRAAAAFYLLHHLPATALPGMLAELRRVLEPGGTLVIATHLGSGPQWVTSEWNGITERVAVACHSKDDLAARVAAAGFGVESVGSRAPRADEFQAEHGFLRARA
jgi:ubiquinone/menaquinone biosynthesis C-methylase UbiE